MTVKSLRKQLAAAIAMTLVATVALGSSTYAWFAVNTKVTATGMNVRTTVTNNLFIASTTTASTTALAESDFKTSDVDNVAGYLQPVSTIDGVNYWYTPKNNVKGNGSVSAAIYNAYEQSAFNANAGTEGAVGYVDYAFQLKAVNSDQTSPAYINLTGINLVYGNTQETSENAFRAAIFVEDLGTTLKAPSGDVGTLKTILKPSEASYFGLGGVESASSVAAVTNLGTAANIATVEQGTTNYYKVVVRLWLEGEDTTCNNTTFANLKDDWALDMTVELQGETGGVNVLSNSTHAKIDLSSDTASTTTKYIDGVAYYQLTTNTSYYTLDSTLSSTSRVFTITGDHPTEVTNQCTLPTS